MAHPPIGQGLLGAMREERKPVRIPEIQDDPRSIGFPPNHPEMHSFLGVPISQGDDFWVRSTLPKSRVIMNSLKKMNEFLKPWLHMPL